MKIVDGNTACSNMAYKLSDISFIYPITPSSPMASNIDNLNSKETLNIFGDTTNVIEMQSEAGAAGALHGALNAGSLGVTFTASQGLLLMIPNMYKMAGECLPAVIHVASRSLATQALSIFGDHQDIYACRPTGFCMLASTNVQDAHNLALVAHASALESSLPFLHFFDGFRTSHEINVINEISDEIIKKIYPLAKVEEFRKRALNSGKAITKGTAQNEDIYFQSMESRNKDYEKVPDVVNDYMQKLNKEINTDYKPFNYYGSPNAKVAIVAMGSVCDTVKKVIKNNPLFGLIEVHLYRPFSSKYLKQVLPKKIKIIGVLDRTKEHGSIGEPLYLDVLSSLKDEDIKIYGGRYGLSSKNVTPNDIYDVYMNLLNEPKDNFTVGIIDDVTNTSLKHYKYIDENDYEEFKIYGYGGDGLVSASKDIIKILGQDNYVQGYFEYDSKKSGGVTISHLRLSDKQINAPYYVNNPKLLVVSKDEYFNKYHMIEGLKPNGDLIINTNKNEKEINEFLPIEVKKYINENNITTYIINADKIAEENNIKGKISLIIETAILNLLKIDNYEEILIENVKKRFLTKGEEIVKSNISAIKSTIENLIKVEINSSGTKKIKKPSNIFEAINYREGYNLTIKDLLKYKDGTFPGGTTKYEKRCISSTAPKWIPEKCIKCGMCALVCPHAVIRPFEDEEKNYKIVVSEADCTGCGLCVATCPTKALEMGEATLKKQEEANNLFEKHENPKYPLTTIKNIELRKPLFEFSGACAGCGETPYIKLLTQIVGEKLVIANATGCSSIYGASCPNTPYKVSWSNSLFEDAAEYGFGILNSYKKMQNRIIKELQNNNSPKAKELLATFENQDYEELKAKLPEFKDFISKDLIDYVLPKSVWTIGGDGWAYDIGFGGLDHVMSCNEKARILVLDTEVYSNTGGQSSKSSHLGQVCEFADNGKKTNKKDLFKIAMSYPNAYVASVSLGGNMMHTIKSFKEAEEHNGPSIIIAYSTCVEQGIKGGMVNSIKEEALAVDSGYVLLMRYFDNKLYLDSKEPNFDKYDEFLSNEVRYNSLNIKNKKEATRLLEINKENAINRYNYYKELSTK